MKRSATGAVSGGLCRSVIALSAAMLCAASCGTTLAPGQAMTTTTVPTASSPPPASSGPGVQPSFETGVPDAVVSFTDVPPVDAQSATGPADEVRRGDDGDLLVTTWGSTTCPRMPVNVAAVDLTTIDIVTGTVRVDPNSNAEYLPETSVCVNDLGPTTSTVRLPEGAAGTGPWTVLVDGVSHTVT